MQRCYIKLEAIGNDHEKGRKLSIGITKELTRELGDDNIVVDLQKELVKMVKEVEKVMTIDFDSAKAMANYTDNKGYHKNKRLDDRQETVVKQVDEPPMAKETKKATQPNLFLDLYDNNYNL